MPALIAICIGHETLTLDLTVPLFDVRDRTVSHVHDAPHEGLLHAVRMRHGPRSQAPLASQAPAQRLQLGSVDRCRAVEHDDIVLIGDRRADLMDRLVGAALE